jgi:hypothetical protein
LAVDTVKKSAPAEKSPAAASVESGDSAVSKTLTDKQRSILTAMLGDLKDLRNMVRSEDGLDEE